MSILKCLSELSLRSLQRIKADPHFLLWLSGVSDLARFVPLSQLLKYGLSWQQKRSTAGAFELLFKMLNLPRAKVEEEPAGPHWNEYQIDPGRVLSESEIDALVYCAKQSAPARSRLTRIFHGWDQRRVMLSDNTSTLSSALLCDHSGHDRKNVKISFES